MKYALTIAALFISSILLQAQEVYDIIYLKDGSIYKGNITEYTPNNQAIIKLLDGRIITFEAATISSMTMGDQNIIKKNFDIKSKGYFLNSAAGPQFGQNTYNNVQLSFAWNMVNGYKINGHHMGIGTGLEKLTENWYLPIYADYSYHFTKNRFRPLAGISTGFMVPLAPNDYNYYYQYNYRNGVFVGGRIGFAAYTSSNFAIQLNLTYRYIHLDGAQYSQFYYPYETESAVTGSADLHRLGFMIGFLFN